MRVRVSDRGLDGLPNPIHSLPLIRTATATWREARSRQGTCFTAAQCLKQVIVSSGRRQHSIFEGYGRETLFGLS